MKPTFGSLFAGIGGFDMGMEQANWECKFQVEWDKHCRSVLDHHWPDVQKWGDIKNVNGRFLPPVDCIIFGSPCQDLSNNSGSSGLGLEGSKSGLFFEAIRIIKEMRDATGNTFPRWAIWENVAGALNSSKGADFGKVLDSMAEAGAVVIEWKLLDSKYFGIPQCRRRVFVAAGFPSDTTNPSTSQIFPVNNCNKRDINKGTEKMFYRSHGSQDAFQTGFSPPVKRISAVCVTSETLRPRQLTPIELERLQGYPDDHTRWNSDLTEQSDSQRIKQCGNGVTTPVAKWVGEQLINAHHNIYPSLHKSRTVQSTE
jgi:DNA (cytosine-5)-methyltransferase 1